MAVVCAGLGLVPGSEQGCELYTTWCGLGLCRPFAVTRGAGAWPCGARERSATWAFEMLDADQALPREHRSLRAIVDGRMDGDDFYTTLACQLIRQVRGRRSQSDLSRRAGYKSNMVQRWEAGECSPHVETFLLDLDAGPRNSLRSTQSRPGRRLNTP